MFGVGTRLTRDQIIDQVSNGTPGGGNMPAYGKQMKPAEMMALTKFLVSLRPPGTAAARPASDPPRPPPAAGRERAEQLEANTPRLGYSLQGRCPALHGVAGVMTRASGKAAQYGKWGS